jgi:hypothetical protein
VQEIRVTKKQRTERVERDLPAGQTLKPPAGSVQDKVSTFAEHGACKFYMSL